MGKYFSSKNIAFLKIFFHPNHNLVRGVGIMSHTVLCWISPTITFDPTSDVYSVQVLKMEYTSDRRVERYGGRIPALVSPSIENYTNLFEFIPRNSIIMHNLYRNIEQKRIVCKNYVLAFN